MFCIPDESLSSFVSPQPKGRPCADGIQEMTGMHKEEKGRLRRQLTTAKVSDGVGNDSEHGVTTSRVRERREIVV